MTEISFALLSDGSSDKRLLAILRWLLYQHCPNLAIQDEWADFRGMRNPPKPLSDQIIKCLELYPSDLLFIHRDSENQTPENRRMEIRSAIEIASKQVPDFPTICVVPVRMQEAWLLFDENAIRKAVGNPNGESILQLPDISTVETLPDPKSLLYDLMKTASELGARRLKKLNVSRRAHLVSEYIRDFSPLRKLSAFNALETDLTHFIEERGYNA